MLIIADENMPHVREYFVSAGAEVRCMPGRTLCREDLLQADVLLVRSVTKVDAGLLQGTPVRFVGSATIGTDHLDIPWLDAQGIHWAHAPGCNARAVAEYVATVTVLRYMQRGLPLPGQRALVLGFGNVGSRVAGVLQQLGFEVDVVDPFVEGARIKAAGCCPIPDLDSALARKPALLTLHVPLQRAGEQATWHLLDAKRLACLEPGSLLLNTSRGPVIDNVALLQRLQQGAELDVVLDVWEGEPLLLPALFQRVWLGTPHIAGYSVQGRTGGTGMVWQAFRQWWLAQGQPALSAPDINKESVSLTMPASVAGDESAEQLAAVMQAAYDPFADHARLAQTLDLPDVDRAQAFDRLRKHYPDRHEWAGLHWHRTDGEVVVLPIVFRALLREAAECLRPVALSA